LVNGLSLKLILKVKRYGERKMQGLPVGILHFKLAPPDTSRAKESF
jgi:hypothetical protein